VWHSGRDPAPQLPRGGEAVGARWRGVTRSRRAPRCSRSVCQAPGRAPRCQHPW
jgi:hypothetical protein